MKLQNTENTTKVLIPAKWEWIETEEGNACRCLKAGNTPLAYIHHLKWTITCGDLWNAQSAAVDGESTPYFMKLFKGTECGPDIVGEAEKWVQDQLNAKEI